MKRCFSVEDWDVYIPYKQHAEVLASIQAFDRKHPEIFADIEGIQTAKSFGSLLGILEFNYHQSSADGIIWGVEGWDLEFDIDCFFNLISPFATGNVIIRDGEDGKLIRYNFDDDTVFIEFGFRSIDWYECFYYKGESDE